MSAPVEAHEGYAWSEAFTAVLEKFLSPLVTDKLKQMYEEGPEPPFVSDSGWGARQTKQEESEVTEGPSAETTSKRGRGRGRGGRGRDKGTRAGKREDNRRVVTEVRTSSSRIHIAKKGTQPIADKAVRTELHKAIRQLFKGNLDSETDTTSLNDDDDGSRISIKWVRGGGRRGGKSAGKGVICVPRSSQQRLLRSMYRRPWKSTFSRKLPPVHPFHAAKDESRHTRRSLVHRKIPSRQRERPGSCRNEGQAWGYRSTRVSEAR